MDSLLQRIKDVFFIKPMFIKLRIKSGRGSFRVLITFVLNRKTQSKPSLKTRLVPAGLEGNKQRLPGRLCP